jgi:hypothetical protein
MLFLSSWKQLMGSLSVLMALLAFGIYGWQTVVGRIRPHPMSWLLFGLLSATGYLVQKDEGAGAGSWVMGAMTIICFLLAAMSVAKGERSFSRQEWVFLIAGCVVFLFYLFTKEPTVAAVLATIVDALGFGPTFVRGWQYPYKDSVTSFTLNSAKYVPSLFAMGTVSVATCIYPVSLVIMNAAVAALLILRRRAVAEAAPVSPPG